MEAWSGSDILDSQAVRRNTLRIVTFLAASILRAQQITALPSWLENYPGATPEVRASKDMVESSYTAAKVQLDDVLAHYQKTFETAKLPFEANPDGIGTTIRAAAPECDLLIRLRERTAGTFVDVYCSTPSKSPAGVAVLSQSQPARVSRAPVAGPPQIPADLMARHKQIAAEMGIGRQHPDAPAPPLVWPSWLVHIQGSPLRPERGANPAGDATLTARYTTNVPMTELRDFYRDLLNAHEYPARATLSTGQTLTGIQQNALGSVEGWNYPDGAPGAYSELEVKFDRSVLNGPITVMLRFTTHDYISKRGY